MSPEFYEFYKVSAVYALPIEHAVPTDTTPTYVYRCIYIYIYAYYRHMHTYIAYYTSTSM